jgi:hypothetical protein
METARMICRTALAALCCLLATGTAGRAQENSLRQALSGLPAAVTESPEPAQALFLDLSALSRVAGQDAGWPPEALRRITSSADMPPIKTRQSSTAVAWDKAAGIPLQQIRTLTSVGEAAVIWRMEGETNLAGVLQHLRQRGFSEGPGGMLTDPGPISVLERMRDPWRSLRQGPSSVLRDGGALVQAPSPDGARRFAGVSPAESAAANPTVRIALGGVEARLGQARIVQAVLFSPQLTWSAADPNRVLRQSAAGARQRMRADAETIGQGLPPYWRGLMVDVAGPERPGLLISLAYPDCGTAETAAAKARAFWDTPAFGQSLHSEISTEAVHVEGGCAATILIETAPQGMANPAFGKVWRAILLREATPMDIR